MTHILIIITVYLIIYFPTLKFKYITDDEEMICRIKEGFFKNRGIIDFIKLRLYGAGTFGLNSEVDHAFTILINMVIGVLIYIAFGSSDISFWAAILYAFNPINHSTSIWLNGRRYAINIILTLGMLLLSNKFGFEGRSLAMILYLSSGLFHMTAILTPILFGPGFILAIVGCGLIFERQIRGVIGSRMDQIAECDMKHFTPKSFIIVIKSYGFYFWRMLIPGVCALIYPDLFYWGKNIGGNLNAYKINRCFFKGVFAFVLCFLACFFIPHDDVYWAIFTILGILQWCNFIPVLQTLADRYISAVCPFMMFFLSYFLHMTGIFYIPFVIIFLIYYYFSLSTVMRMYQNIETFYEYQIDYFPQIPVPALAYIECLMLTGKMDKALAIIRNGLMENPKDFEFLRFGALFSLFKQDYDHGIVFINEAEKNLYIGQEIEQRNVLENLRKQFNAIKKSSSPTSIQKSDHQ